MAVLNPKPQNNNKENVSHSKMITISVKVPLDSSSSIDKDKIQFRIRRRQPLKDITNLFVSASPLPSSPTLSFDSKCIKGRSGVGLKTAATSSKLSCRNFRWFSYFVIGIYRYHAINIHIPNTQDIVPYESFLVFYPLNLILFLIRFDSKNIDIYNYPEQNKY